MDAHGGANNSGNDNTESGVPRSDLDDEYELLIGTTDMELLKRAWRHEKTAPEMLRFEEALVERAQEQLLLMEETVEDFSQNGVDPISMSLYQMDLDRLQFWLRSYLRIRILKIEKYALHISKTDLWDHLSEKEKMFANKYIDGMEKHLKQSILAKLPEGYKDILRQSPASEVDDMIPEPNLNTFVVCRSKGDLRPFELPDSDGVPLELLAGDLHILRYKSIKILVESGDVELL